MVRISDRKESHISISIEEDVQSRYKTTGFEDVHFIHRALPNISLEEVDVSTRIFGHKISAPILIESITGGTEKTRDINASLAEAAETLKLAMGVGSQRAALENPSLEYTFRVVREKAPNIFLIANLGAPQLVKGYGKKEAKQAVDMIDADALFIHLNPLQEIIQPEGETDYRGVHRKIEEIVNAVDVPVIVKETGAGIAYEEAVLLEKIGVNGIDVAGSGGTSWAAVEYFRAKKMKNKLRESLGRTFWDWGIPTASSIVEVHLSTKNMKIFGSGGIRNGLEVAKSIALGADMAGFAMPVLKPVIKGTKKAQEALKAFIEELRVAMFLTGCKTIEDLKSSPIIITGKISEWLKSRGFNPELYRRK